MASVTKRGKNSFLLMVELCYDGKEKKKLYDFLQAELYKFQAEVEAGEYIAPEKNVLCRLCRRVEIQ